VSQPLPSTPAADGFHMPAEWDAHDGCWMIWPERPDNWRLHAGPAQETFAQVADAINRCEPLTMVASAAEAERCRAALSPSIRVLEIATDDAWMRDTGPTFVIDGDGRRRGVDWEFNAWGGLQGGLYSSWENDDRLAGEVLRAEADERYRAPLVLEGGSIHVDGQGTVLTTEQCLLNPNRNPSLTRAEIERTLLDHLGASKVIWLGEGVPGDETDGHIDNLACFIRPGVVLLSWSDDPADPQHEVSHDAMLRLSAATDAQGRQLEVVRIPAPRPDPIGEDEAAGVQQVPGTAPRRAGEALAGSYVNFYLPNGGLVFPLLDQRTDEQAAAILSSCFPDREFIGIPAREILLGGGNIHCITQQVPAAHPSLPNL